MISYQFNLEVTPGSMPPILHMAQYDTGRTFVANLKNNGVAFTPTQGSEAKIKGRNAAGVCWEQEATISSSTVEFTPEGAATDQFGIMPVQLEIYKGDVILSTLLMVFDIQRAGYTNEQAASSPEFQNAMEEAAEKYVLGMDTAARVALLELLSNVAYINDRGPELYDNLEDALAAKLVSISAVFTQSGTVHDTDSLDSLKSGLIVTALYDNGDEIEVSSYTLSGTLSAGTSTVTVAFGGKTTTFDVTVTSGTLYSLENQSVSNERIIPGVAPFTTADADLTVGIDISYTSLPSSGTGCKPILINLATDSSTLAVGFAVEASNNKAHWMGQSINAGSRSSERTRVILTHAKDSGSMSVYLRQGTGSKQTYTVSGTFATTSKQFSFGQGTSGNYVLPAGTINKAAIYDYVLSDYAIDQFLGLGGA